MYKKKIYLISLMKANQLLKSLINIMLTAKQENLEPLKQNSIWHTPTIPVCKRPLNKKNVFIYNFQ